MKSAVIGIFRIQFKKKRAKRDLRKLVDNIYGTKRLFFKRAEFFLNVTLPKPYQIETQTPLYISRSIKNFNGDIRSLPVDRKYSENRKYPENRKLSEKIVNQCTQTRKILISEVSFFPHFFLVYCLRFSFLFVTFAFCSFIAQRLENFEKNLKIRCFLDNFGFPGTSGWPKMIWYRRCNSLSTYWWYSKEFEFLSCVEVLRLQIPAR